MTEGPFYPDKLPLDTDNDLVIVNDSLTPAVGEVTHLTGRVLDTSGGPIKDATVEIWQCDAHAVYLHTADSGRKKAQQDKNFQGFGRSRPARRASTGSAPSSRWRTPAGRRPHIHVKVKKGDRELLTTQFMVAGNPGNERDGVFRGLRDPIQRELVLVDFKPVADSKVGELAAVFDIVVGRTPDESDPEPKRPARR